MRRFFFAIVCVAISIVAFAQDTKSAAAKPFHTYIYNKEYMVYLDLNLYDNDIKVPGQDIFGNVQGYFGASRDSRKWLITSAKLDGTNKASLDIINDYGSEDLLSLIHI